MNSVTKSGSVQTVLLVDDESLARRRLASLLDKLPDISVIGEAENAEQALAFNEQHKPDIVLLDIQMPGMNGIQVARRLAILDRPPAVIFCTAFDQHALDAFEARAIGYLLKPVSQAALGNAIAQAQSLNRSQLTAIEALDTEGEQTNRRCVSAKTADGYQIIAIEDIRAFVAEMKYVVAYSPGGELVLDDTLQELQEEFGDLFSRVHRNALVAKSYIRALKNTGDQHVLSLDGVDVEPVVSRRHLSEVRQMIKSL